VVGLAYATEQISELRFYIKLSTRRYKLAVKSSPCDRVGVCHRADIRVEI
jgi:hypothetical protein